MNEFDRLHRIAKGLRERYPEGTRVELGNMNDDRAVGIFLPMASALTLLNNQVVTLICGAEPTYLASTIFNDGFSAQSGTQLVCVSVVFVAIAVISMTMFKKKEIK